MTQKTVYEWDCETVDEHGDVQDHNHFDTLEPALAFQRESTDNIEIALVRDTLDEFDGLTDRFRAYVYKGNLDDVMADGGGGTVKTPKRFMKAWLNRAISEDTRDALRWVGLMGHEFVILHPRDGKEVCGAEVNTIEDARRFAEEGDTIYQQLPKRKWKRVS